MDGSVQEVVDSNAVEPLPAWRRVLFLNPCRLLVRYIMFLMGFYSIKVKGKLYAKVIKCCCKARALIMVSGTPASRQEAPIVVANHVSFIDPFYLFIAYLPSFVAKKEVEDLPVVGTVATALQCLMVDRRSVTSRKDTLDLVDLPAPLLYGFTFLIR